MTTDPDDEVARRLIDDLRAQRQALLDEVGRLKDQRAELMGLLAEHERRNRELQAEIDRLREV